VFEAWALPSVWGTALSVGPGCWDVDDGLVATAGEARGVEHTRAEQLPDRAVEEDAVVMAGPALADRTRVDRGELPVIA